MTTLQGGDVFQYTDLAGAVASIHLNGNIIAEVIGLDNAGHAVDLQGTFTGGTRNTQVVGSAAAGDLFAIYVTHSEAGSTISVVGAAGPFSGSAGTVAGFEAPDNSGTVYIGGRPNGNLIVSTTLSSTLGVVVPGTSSEIGVGNNLSAGITVADRLLEFVSTADSIGGRSMGQSLGNIIASSVDATNGLIYVVDSDGLDTTGFSTGFQLSAVSLATGQAQAPVTIQDINGPLTNVTAIAIEPSSGTIFASHTDPTGAGAEFGTIDPVTGLFTAIGVVDLLGIPFLRVQSMAFRADGVLFGTAIGTTNAPPSLVTINTASGDATVVGELAIGDATLLTALNAGRGVAISNDADFQITLSKLTVNSQIDFFNTGVGINTNGALNAKDLLIQKRNGANFGVDLDDIDGFGTNAVTIQDVIDAIAFWENQELGTSDIVLSIALDQISLKITDSSVGQVPFAFSIKNDVGSTAASDLGIAKAINAAGVAPGVIAGDQVVETISVDLQAGDTTILAVRNRIEAAATATTGQLQQLVSVTFAADGKRLVVTDNTFTDGTASSIVISSLNGTAAFDLGILAADVNDGLTDGSITGTPVIADFGPTIILNTTLLSTLNSGRGISIAEGNDIVVSTTGLTLNSQVKFLNAGVGVNSNNDLNAFDFQITKRDSTIFEVDLNNIDGLNTQALTLQDVADAIAFWENLTLATNDVTLSIGAAGKSLVLTDISVAVGDITVADSTNSTAATDLFGAAPTINGAGQLIGELIVPDITIDFPSDSATVLDIRNAIASGSTATTGQETQLLTSIISGDGQRLIIVDLSFTNGGQPTMSISAADGSTAGRDLGIITNDSTDGAVDGEIIGGIILPSRGSLVFNGDGVLLGLDFHNGQLVDIGLIPDGSNNLVIGTNVATGLGSVRPTVGGLGFATVDTVATLFAVDNATTRESILGFSETESASLMKLIDQTPEAALTQNMDSILVDGAVTGRVNISGAIDTFYSGWLLTGVAGGQAIGAAQDPGNFFVGGELRNLITTGTIGGDVGDSDNPGAPAYFTGTDIRVGGRVGQIIVLGASSGSSSSATGSMFASLTVENNTDAPQLNSPWRELSLSVTDGQSGAAITTAFAAGRLAIAHDTFDNPQYVGTAVDSEGLPTSIVLNGLLHPPADAPDPGDPVITTYPDYYAVPVMGGQTVSVSLQQPANVRWGQYIGGDGADNATSVTVGPDGFIYVIGTTASASFVQGGFDQGQNGGNDAFIAKLNSAGSVIWSTFLGGVGDEAGAGISVDTLGNVWVTGSTTDASWVTLLNPAAVGGDAFVAKITTAGQLVWSTSVGGDLLDSATAIAADDQGNAYVTGSTLSADWTANGFDTTHGGDTDGFLVKIDGDGATEWSTYIGGTQADAANALVIDSLGNVIIVGVTASTTDISTTSAFAGGITDGFAVQFDSDGALNWSNYIGGIADDVAKGVAVDSRDRIYVGGSTGSDEWIAGGVNTTFGGGSTDGFAAKLNADGSAVWSTLVGGDDADAVNGVAVNRSGDVYVVGDTTSSDWVDVAFQPTLNGAQDAFFTKITRDGQRITSSFLGGENSEQGLAIARDRSGNFYVAGSTDSTTGIANNITSSFAGGATDGFLTSINEPGFLAIGVFNPDNQLIATNYSNVDSQAALEAAIHFTADRPGVYRIAVALHGDADFVADGDFTPTSVIIPPGLGNDGTNTGAAATVQALPLTPIAYRLVIGGLGDLAISAVVAPENIAVIDLGMQIVRGDLGAVEAGNFLVGAGNDVSPNIDVAQGSLRAIIANSIGQTSGLGDLSLADGITLSVPNGSVGLVSTAVAGGVGQPGGGPLFLNPNSNVAPIGGDYQLIDAGDDLAGNFRANGGIGVIRVGGNFGNPDEAPTLEINASGSGNSTIDLIDVHGDFGTSETGGVQITTHTGGNVRYIQVAGDVFQDHAFGVGLVPARQLDVGQSTLVTDDSGTQLRIAPLSFRTIVSGTTTTPYAGQLTLETYPVRGSGGVVVLNVTSDEGVTITNESSGLRGEISSVDANGAGQPLVANAVTGVLALSTVAGVAPLHAIFSGAPIDVLSVTGGAFSSIRNSTGGEIVNVDATSVGTLSSSSNLGIAASHTGAAVRPIAVIQDAFPLVDARTGIQLSGSALAITTAEAIGNVIVGGTIVSIRANNDRSAIVPGTPLQGIVGAVVADDINSADIGQGIAYAGSGESGVGLFATGIIASVIGQDGANILGDVISTADIGSINLSNGSIINANIAVVGALGNAREYAGFLADATAVTGTIGTTILRGNGGILGSYFSAATIGSVNAPTGFGVINSTFESIVASGSVSTSGSIGAFTVGGLGVRNTLFESGGDQGLIVLRGNGDTLDVTSLASDVRVSDSLAVDPRFGMSVNRLTDINVFLNTSLDDSIAPGITDSGLIADTTIRGFGRFRGLVADRISNVSITFGNIVDRVSTTGAIDGLDLTTGSLGTFSPGSDVFRLRLAVAGPISNLDIRGSLGADSVIIAKGPTGFIGNFNVDGDFSGALSTTGFVRTIAIGGDFIGSINIQGNSDGIALRTLRVGGDLKQTSFIVNGGIGSIIVGGDFGLDAESVLVAQDVDSITVGGELISSLIIDGNLKSLKVGSTATAGNDLSGNVAVTGEFGKLTVINGGIDGNVNVGGKLGAVSVSGGDINGDLASATGDILAITVTGTLAGDILAALGDIGKITVGGGLASTIQAQNLAGLTVAGAFSGSLQLAGLLRTAKISGDLDANSTIVAGSLGSLTVLGTDSGQIIVTGAAQQINAAALNNALIAIGQSLAKLNVTNSVTGSVIQLGVTRDGTFAAGSSFTGGLGAVKIGSMDNSMLLSGGSIGSFTSLGAVNDSSINAGLVLDRADMDTFAGGAPLDAAARTNLLTGSTLLRGSIKTFSVKTGGLTNATFVTAGVSPGADGSFATAGDNSAVPGTANGLSNIGSLKTAIDATSNVITNSGVRSSNLTGLGAANVLKLSHTLDQLLVNNPIILGQLVQTATAGNPVIITLAGQTLTVSLSGPGQAQVFDDPATLGVVDNIVLSGTTTGSKLKLTASDPDSITLGRLIGEDDAALSSLTFNGDIVGDATADPDFVIDSLKTLTVRNLGGDSLVGSDVSSATLASLSAGATLSVAGKLTRIKVTAASLGSFSAQQIATVQLAAGFTGGIASTAGGIKSISIVGDFGGSISSLAELTKLSATGHFTVTSSVTAASIKSATITGNLVGDITTPGTAVSLKVGGQLAGAVNAGSAGTIKLGSTAAASLVQVAGNLASVTVTQAHLGTVAALGDVGRATFGSFDTGGLFDAGQNVDSITVNGDMINGLISIGTWIGDDGVFNSDDDVIFGGSARSIRVVGDFRNSAVTAGVLPALNVPDGIPADFNSFVPTAANDQIEAGGIHDSRIDLLQIIGDVISSNASGKRLAVVATVDGLTTLKQGGGAVLSQQFYPDAIGAPTIVGSTVIKNVGGVPTEFDLSFSESINTSSLVLGGTVLVRDNTDTDITGVQILHTTYLTLDGRTASRLRIIRAAGFVGEVTVTLKGDPANPTIFDRSGGRSILRSWGTTANALELAFGGAAANRDVDALGTILDGNSDGVEGDDFVQIF